MHDTKPDHQKLFEIASERGGYFTAAQARSCGFSWALLTHHSKTGRFLRIRRGLYRLREYPSSPREDVLAAWLGAGADVAVVSHESALDLHELSDIIPEVVHLTLARSKRYRPASRGIAIHTTTRPFAPADTTVREGIRITSAARSIVDAADAGTAPEQIVTAAADAIQRGLTTKQELLSLGNGRGARVERLLRQGIEQSAQDRGQPDASSNRKGPRRRQLRPPGSRQALPRTSAPLALDHRPNNTGKVAAIAETNGILLQMACEPPIENFEKELAERIRKKMEELKNERK